MSRINFSETYLFKLRTLSSLLEKVFDQALRRYAQTTLSQFMLLLILAEHRSINQRTVARFLEISPAAINRQVELAQAQGFIMVEAAVNGHSNLLSLTAEGDKVIQKGMSCLEQHVFQIFADENRQTSLMEHLDLLLKHAKGVASPKTKKSPPHQSNQHN